MLYKDDVVDNIKLLLDGEGEYTILLVKNLNDEIKKIIIRPYKKELE